MSDTAGLVLLAGRILFSVMFLVSGVGHLTRGQMMVGYARSKAFPLAAVSGWPTGLYLLVGALSVALGIWPDVGALLLALFVTVSAFYFHNFWAVEDPETRQTEQLNFFRNITLLGASIVLFACFASAGAGLQFALTAPLIQF